MLKLFKKKEKELVSVEDYLEILKLGTHEPDSEEFKVTKKFVDSQILPELHKLITGPVEYIVTIPSYEEYLEEWFSGRWETVSKDYYLDKGYFYFWRCLGVEIDEAVVIVDLITQVLSYYGYSVTWKCSGRNIIFNIKM